MGSSTPPPTSSSSCRPIRRTSMSRTPRWSAWRSLPPPRHAARRNRSATGQLARSARHPQLPST
eukprot:14766433-Alexandrium_andersonii.AAC.1